MSTDTAASYKALYNAIAGQIGGSEKNFQLLTPMQVWNWDVKPVGQTSSDQYSFLNGMPIYSPLGKYQSGSSFADAYRTWLNTLVVKADKELQNRITIQAAVLGKAANKYSTDREAAIKAYNDDPTVKDQVPTFIDWLNEPYGKGAAYKTIIDADKIPSILANFENIRLTGKRSAFRIIYFVRFIDNLHRTGIYYISQLLPITGPAGPISFPTC